MGKKFSLSSTRLYMFVQKKKKKSAFYLNEKFVAFILQIYVPSRGLKAKKY